MFVKECGGGGGRGKGFVFVFVCFVGLGGGDHQKKKHPTVLCLLCSAEKFGNRDYILTLDYATMDDDAEYMVVARNVAGEVRSTAQVIVEPYAGKVPGRRNVVRSTEVGYGIV